MSFTAVRTALFHRSINQIRGFPEWQILEKETDSWEVTDESERASIRRNATLWRLGMFLQKHMMRWYRTWNANASWCLSSLLQWMLWCHVYVLCMVFVCLLDWPLLRLIINQKLSCRNTSKSCTKRDKRWNINEAHIAPDRTMQQMRLVGGCILNKKCFQSVCEDIRCLYVCIVVLDNV